MFDKRISPWPSVGPNYFGQVLTNLYGPANSFWLGPNHIGQVQIIKIIPEKSNLNLAKII